jgi:predicted ATPase
LRLVSEALRTNLRNAVEQRGEVRQIIRRGNHDPQKFSIELTVGLAGHREGKFSVTIGDDQGLPAVEAETCTITTAGQRELSSSYLVRNGQVERLTVRHSPAVVEGFGRLNSPRARIDQLYLSVVSGYSDFGDLYDQMRGMRFFNISPEMIRIEASALRPASELAWDGQAASAVQRLLQNKQEVKERIDEYLHLILPVLTGVTVSTSNTSILPRGSYIKNASDELFSGEPRSPYFVFDFGEMRLAFGPNSISDGTLRAFGVLLALFQAKDRPPHDPISLVGIEEPEASLHPAAGVLWDAMNEASHFTQVLASTHSVELLDRKDIGPKSLLVVEMVNGETRIGAVDHVGQSIMKDRLATAGELLKQNRLFVERHVAGSDSAPALQP